MTGRRNWGGKKRSSAAQPLNFSTTSDSPLASGLRRWRPRQKLPKKIWRNSTLNGKNCTSHDPHCLLSANKVSAVLLRKIHSYEEEWHRAFNQVDDLDAVSIPLSSKKDIVETNRQCPTRKHRGIGRRSEHYCTTWLLTNVGRRFLTFHSNQLRLRSTTLGGITQTDLSCSNEVWSSFKPLSTQQPAQFAPPRYFAPVPSLRRA